MAVEHDQAPNVVHTMALGPLQDKLINGTVPVASPASLIFMYSQNLVSLWQEQPTSALAFNGGQRSQCIPAQASVSFCVLHLAFMPPPAARTHHSRLPILSIHWVHGEGGFRSREYQKIAIMAGFRQVDQLA